RICGASWRAVIVSTRPVPPPCLLNPPACRRSSSSAAGTKWFHERKLSSRFCARAGARSRAVSERPATAPAEACRNRRRLTGAVMSGLLSDPTIDQGPRDLRKVKPFYCRGLGLSRRPACQHRWGRLSDDRAAAQVVGRL